MKIKPLHDRVLVRRLDEVTKTNGGIIIPDTAKEKPSEGVVEAVGTGRVAPDGKVVAMTVKVDTMNGTTDFAVFQHSFSPIAERQDADACTADWCFGGQGVHVGIR